MHLSIATDRLSGENRTTTNKVRSRIRYIQLVCMFGSSTTHNPPHILLLLEHHCPSPKHIPPLLLHLTKFLSISDPKTVMAHAPTLEQVSRSSKTAETTGSIKGNASFLCFTRKYEPKGAHCTVAFLEIDHYSDPTPIATYKGDVSVMVKSFRVAMATLSREHWSHSRRISKSQNSMRTRMQM